MIRQLNPLSKGVKLSKYAALCAGTAFVMTSAMPAYAAPEPVDPGNMLGLTASGTDVSNTVTLSFNVGGVAQTPVVSDPAVFEVDAMVDVLVVSNGGDTVTPGETFATATLAYTVVNEGNVAAGQGYALDIVYNTENDVDFSAMVLAAGAPGLGEYALYIDQNNDGLWDALDTLYNTALSVNAFSLTPDQQANVLVVAGIPLNAIEGDTGSFTVVAQTLNPVAVGAAGTATTETLTPGILTIDTVFLDTISDDPLYAQAGEDVLEDGFHSDVGIMTVSDAGLTATKSVRVINDNATSLGCGVSGNTPEQSTADNLFAIVGACVEYTITVTQAGTADSNDVGLSDQLPGGVTFDGIITSTSLAKGTQILLTNKTSADFYNGETVANNGFADVAPGNNGNLVTATEATFASGQAPLVLVIRAIVD